MRRKERKSDNGTFFTIPVIISGIVLLLILFGAVFAKFIAPYNPEANDYSAALARAFTQGHLLGTDKLGRDLWSRLLCGAQTSIINAILIVVFEVVVGVPIGMICGYYGGKLDNIVMRVWDIVCSVPSLLLAFVLVAAFGKGTYSGVIAIGIVYTPLTAKLSRSLIMTEKSAVYVEACKSLGYSDARIMFVHILPNIVTTMVAQFTLDIGSAITAMATLSYLGIGVQAPGADWGTLLKDGMSMLYLNPVLLVAPTIAIMITAIAINIFSDGIQSYIDPGQRKMPTFKQYRKKLLKPASGRSAADKKDAA
ncbi:MAG: ABC transporter permease [[Eubacterium] rectale]|nr:ABC transporter permease [Agathobacter rectalis]